MNCDLVYSVYQSFLVVVVVVAAAAATLAVTLLANLPTLFVILSGSRYLSSRARSRSAVSNIRSKSWHLLNICFIVRFVATTCLLFILLLLVYQIYHIYIA